MSDRSWRDFFESRSFYEYQIFSQKLPLRYGGRRAQPFPASPFTPNRDFEDIRWRRRRRRRCAGFYWCCCCKIIALLMVTLVLLSLIGGLSYYFSKKESSQTGNQLPNTTYATSPITNWTYPTTSWNPYTNGSTLFGTTIRKPSDGTPTTEGYLKISSTSGPMDTTDTTSGTEESISLLTTTKTNTFNTLLVNESDSTTAPGNFFSSNTNPTTKTSVATATSTVQDSEPTMNTVVQRTSPSLTRTNSTPTVEPINFTTVETRTSDVTVSGHTTNLDDNSDQISTLSAHPTPTEDTDVSTVLAEDTTSEEEYTTPWPWRHISSTLISSEFTEEMTTPEPWLDVSRSTLSDGTTEIGSGLGEDD